MIRPGHYNHDDIEWWGAWLDYVHTPCIFVLTSHAWPWGTCHHRNGRMLITERGCKTVTEEALIATKGMTFQSQQGEAGKSHKKAYPYTEALAWNACPAFIGNACMQMECCSIQHEDTMTAYKQWRTKLSCRLVCSSVVVTHKYVQSKRSNNHAYTALNCYSMHIASSQQSYMCM